MYQVISLSVLIVSYSRIIRPTRPIDPLDRSSSSPRAPVALAQFPFCQNSTLSPPSVPKHQLLTSSENRRWPKQSPSWQGQEMTCTLFEVLLIVDWFGGSDTWDGLSVWGKIVISSVYRYCQIGWVYVIVGYSSSRFRIGPSTGF